MKTLALAFFVFCVATICRAANPSLENFDQLYFKTNAPAPGIIQTRMNTNQFRSPVLPGDTWTITNVTGLTGASHWTNVAGVLHPVDGSSVLVTNLTATSNTVNVGTMTWLSKSIVLTNGVNYLPSGKYSQLQLISPSTDPSLVQIVLSNGWNTVQHLEIFNLTNAVPSQGAFTLTNLTPIPDSLGGGVVKLINNENWVATNGCGIELRFISPDWVEQFRSDVSGNPTFITNTYNNIVVISNTTLRGRITINNINVTTNDLWKTNFTGTSTNLLPVDPSLYVLAPNGYLAGANTAVAVNNALASTRDSNLGELDANGISIISRNSLANTEAAFSIGGAILGGYSEALYSKDTTTRWEIGRSVDSTVGADFYIGTNGIGGLVKYIDLSPNAADGTAIVKLGTAATHTTGNLFELSNNTTNRVVVTPLSTLIGSPVTSPNFSVPAALEVSNFQDRGKALTVDIKLGASGNNDDYPVYFYSQITNSSSHPTINMEEVSPSGYIGGAHTLLSVQETPKVTNTVSTWPTYAAASTTAGYFNAAPTGGTNGAAMGLQGSVDPTRNFINIGVGSYVEATTDNLAATNIAFSGTVNQVLGTQKAVGGLFEIGSLANIPSIPSSAGVLIDGHNSGAPLIIAQTNGAVQFKVAANSGYAGAGTTFLADDGTYKAAGGGGGSTLWTTNANGFILPSPSNSFVVANSLTIATNLTYPHSSIISTTTDTNLVGCEGIAITNNVALIVGDGALPPMSIYDVANPLKPVLLSTFGNFKAYTVAVSGTHAYIVDHASDILHSIDVSNLSAPAYSGHLTNAAFHGSEGVTIIGTTLFCVTLGNNIASVNISNPASMVFLTNLVDNVALNQPYQITNDGTNVFVAVNGVDSASGRMTIIDGTNPSFLSVKGSVQVTEGPDAIAVSGNYAYVGCFGWTTSGGFSIVDISNPASPSVVSSLFDARLNGPTSATIHGSVVYTVGTGSDPGNLVSISVADPYNPRIVSNLISSSLNGASAVAANGNALFIPAGFFSDAAPANSLTIIDSAEFLASSIPAKISSGDVAMLSLVTSTNGFASFATNTGAISSTGWTNSLGKDADVAFDATTLVYKLADNAGSWWYTNSVAVGQGFIHLQPGGKFVLVSGSGLTGQYHAH